jgi:hypothetical protein
VITGGKVLALLCPNVEWTIYGDDFESINWHGEKPAITKSEFENGFAQCEKLEADKNALILEKREALLAKLGITEEEAKFLLS